jgi:anaerobic magnesium-protoporphyrin IX monomethyl ester cyclase
MADIVLAHSYHLHYDPKQVRKMQPYPPLGTLYAAGALQQAGFSVAVFDPMLREPVGFAEMLSQELPQIVAIYEDDFNFLSKMCLTRCRELAWELAQIARAFGCRVVVHGSDATDHPQAYLENGAEFVLVGEAEQTLSALCASLLRRRPFEPVPGVLSLDEAGNLKGDAAHGSRNPEWKHLPRPARELVDLAPYRDAWKAAHGYFSTNVVASRGCPFHCNWCAKPISGNRFQLRSAVSVASEIQELHSAYGVDHIWFGDDVFALNQHWVQEFATAIETLGCAVPFKIQSRADLMSPETVKALKRAGCAEVWMGAESGSQRVLDAMEKGLRVEQVEVARDRLARHGIRACYFLQFGYPGEQWHDILQTIHLVRRTRPDDIGVSISYPLPGTPFFERVQAQMGAKKNWTDSDDLSLMFTSAYSSDFYRALRDALHAEVDSWKAGTPVPGALWQRVFALEQTTRNPQATVLQECLSSSLPSQLVQLECTPSHGAPEGR